MNSRAVEVSIAGGVVAMVRGTISLTITKPYVGIISQP